MAGADHDPVESADVNTPVSQLALHAWDIVVIGSGPAGTVAGSECARLGARRVLIVDRATFPRTKVCGCCLSPLAQDALRRLDLQHVLHQHQATTVDRLELRERHQTAHIALTAQPVLSRSHLDAALLHEAARRGCQIRTGVHAEILPPADTHRRTIRLRDLASAVEAEVVASIVIDARGLSGRPDRVARNSAIGAGAIIEDPEHIVPPNRVVMAIGERGYVGMTRLEDDRVVVGAAIRGHRAQNGDPSWWSPVISILEASGGPYPEQIQQARWRGTPALTQRPRSVADHRLFRVGDAAGYVEPFTGEGIGWAIEGARRLAPVAVEAASGWSDDRRQRWEHIMHRFSAWRGMRCRSIAWTLAHPTVVHPFVWIGARWPRFASSLARGLTA